MEKTTGTPFYSAEEAWFWFIAAQEARHSGARIMTGVGTTPRPCEPVDILTVLDRLYRNQRLDRNHLMVLRHYGRRGKPPLPDRVKERRAAHIWAEAMAILEEPLVSKGIVQETMRGAEESFLRQRKIFPISIVIFYVCSR